MIETDRQQKLKAAICKPKFCFFNAYRAYEIKTAEKQHF